MKEAINTIVLAMEAFKDLEKYLKDLRELVKNNSCEEVPTYRNRPEHIEGNALETDIAIVKSGLKQALRTFRALDELIDGGDNDE